MPAIFFAFVALIGWGTGDIFNTISARRIGPHSTNLWGAILSVVIFSLYAPFVLSDISHLTFQTLMLNIFLGITFGIALLSFIGGLAIENPSLVGTISSAFAAVAVILSVIFLGDRLNINQTLIILLIFLGIFLSTFDLKLLSKGKLKFSKGVLLALVSMLAWGIYFTFIKFPVRQIGWFWPEYITFVMIILTTFVIMRLSKVKVVKPNVKNAIIPISFAIVFLRAADMGYNLAIKDGLTAIVAPISGAYPVLFACIAFFVFKDRITKQQILGIVTTLIGIVLLSYFSV